MAMRASRFGALQRKRIDGDLMIGLLQGLASHAAPPAA
jgi:hypothetical protein